MTPTDLFKLTPEEKRVKIAELCGTHAKAWRFWYDGHDQQRICAIRRNKETAERDYLWHQKYGKPSDIEEFTDLEHVPDYLNSLDAIAQAEAMLTEEQAQRYADYLVKIVQIDVTTLSSFASSFFRLVHSSAKQRSTAFLLTIG